MPLRSTISTGMSSMYRPVASVTTMFLSTFQTPS
jgi:hypothetical protein